jgi:hypothetical protein
MTLPPNRPLGQTLVLSAVVIGTSALGAVVLYAVTGWLGRASGPALTARRFTPPWSEATQGGRDMRRFSSGKATENERKCPYIVAAHKDKRPNIRVRPFGSIKIAMI